MSNTIIKDELSAKITQSTVPVWVVDGVECRDFPSAVKQLLVRVIALGSSDEAQGIADRMLSTGSRSKIRALLDMLDEYEVMEKLKPSESGDRTQIR
jgi:hypothetical protein